MIILTCVLAAAPAWCYGELIRSGPQNLFLGPWPQPISIDLDFNNQPDLLILSTCYTTTDLPPSASECFYHILDTYGNFVWVQSRSVAPVTGPVIAPPFGTVPGTWSPDNWLFIGSYSYLYDWTNNEYEWSGWQGNWADVDIGHIGILFRAPNGKLHLAWIRLLVPDDAEDPSPIILDWAYNSEPVKEPYATRTIIPTSSENMEAEYHGLQPGLSYAIDALDDLAGTWATIESFVAESTSASAPMELGAACKFQRLRRVP